MNSEALLSNREQAELNTSFPLVNRKLKKLKEQEQKLLQ